MRLERRDGLGFIEPDVFIELPRMQFMDRRKAAPANGDGHPDIDAGRRVELPVPDGTR